MIEPDMTLKDDNARYIEIEKEVSTNAWRDLRKRKGHFQISKRLLEVCDDSIFKLFGNVIVVRCEYLFEKDVFDYYAFSPLFEEIVEYIQPPDYEFVVNKDEETGEVTVRVVQLLGRLP